MEAMLTFLSKKVPDARRPSAPPDRPVTETKIPETLPGQGPQAMHQKSRIIPNSYTQKEKPLKPLSILLFLSSFFRPRQPLQHLHNTCHKTNTYPREGVAGALPPFRVHKFCRPVTPGSLPGAGVESGMAKRELPAKPDDRDRGNLLWEWRRGGRDQTGAARRARHDRGGQR